jgi:DNA-binding MarR family transcriptional regulator
MSDPSMTEPGVEVTRLLLRCHQLQKELAASFALSVDEFHCITQLYFHAPCCVKTLRELLGVSPTRASKLLAGLESRGYLTRSLAADDKRKERLALTSKGGTVAEKILDTLSREQVTGAIPEGMNRFLEVREMPEDS